MVSLLRFLMYYMYLHKQHEPRYMYNYDLRKRLSNYHLGEIKIKSIQITNNHQYMYITMICVKTFIELSSWKNKHKSNVYTCTIMTIIHYVYS